LLSVAVLAEESDPAAYLAAALAVPASTRATFTVHPDRIDLTFVSPVDTLLGLLPHHRALLAGNPGPTVGRYETVRGTIEVVSGRSFTVSYPRPPVIPGLPLASSLRADRAFLDELQREVSSLPLQTAGDVYAAGKQVLRSAQLVLLADQSGDAYLRDRAVTAAWSQLADWCTALPEETERVLAFDRELGSIVPIPPAFGSEHGNDHHFHAGYFLEAAALLASVDPSFADQYGDCIRLLIGDIASTASDASFPRLRHMDLYAGHSWANGLTLFGDAQNQESSSEALQAWHGIALWGRVTGDRSLEELGTALLAIEAAGTRAYWFNSLSGAATLPREFAPGMVSILWSGKADYATFFDADPAAIHGIQLFPPASVSWLASVDGDLLGRLAEPLSSSPRPTIWTTTLLLASALDGSGRSLPEHYPLDPALTRSTATHWLAALRELGAYRSSLEPEHSCGAVFGQTAIVYRGPRSPSSCAFDDEATGRRMSVTGLAPGWNVRPLQ
jgi:hypothetical protein